MQWIYYSQLSPDKSKIWLKFGVNSSYSAILHRYFTYMWIISIEILSWAHFVFWNKIDQLNFGFWTVKYWLILSSIWSFDSEFWTPENQIHHFHILVLSLNYYIFFTTQNPFFRFTRQLQIKSQKSHRNYYWQFHDEFNSLGHESWKCNFSLKMQFFVKNVKKMCFL